MKINRLQLLMILLFLLNMMSKASSGQHIIKKDVYKLVHTDTIGPYYVFLMKSRSSPGDTVTVLSLTDQTLVNTNKMKMEPLKLGRSYALTLESMRTIRVSSDTSIEAIVDLRYFYLDNKMLLKVNEFPYRSKNIDRTYYIIH